MKLSRIVQISQTGSETSVKPVRITAIRFISQVQQRCKLMSACKKQKQNVLMNVSEIMTPGTVKTVKYQQAFSVLRWSRYHNSCFTTDAVLDVIHGSSETRSTELVFILM